MTTCLLQNSNVCSKRKSINNAKTDNKIRVVFGYEWSTMSDNYVLIYELVREVLDTIENQYDVKCIYKHLGGKDGSIYCNICHQVRTADVAIFDLSTYNRNVIFELGLAVGAGARIFILRSKHYKKKEGQLSDLNGILEYRFSRRNANFTFEADFRRSLTMRVRNVVEKKLALKSV
jgi:hypothetical protein